MESLSQILEEELENAVEVKDKKSLHRYVVLMTENIVSRKENLEQFQMLRDDIRQNRGDIRDIVTTMKAGFESADKRFEDLQHQMDQRFSAQFKFLTFGFTINVVLMSLYTFL